MAGIHPWPSQGHARNYFIEHVTWKYSLVDLQFIRLSGKFSKYERF